MAAWTEQSRIRVMTRVFREEDAAVTVSVLVMGTAMILLFLAIFNFGKYLMAIRQSETALEASAASVLSHYEKELVREMGLFALDTKTEKLEDLGAAYFTDNLGASDSLNGQKLTRYTLIFNEEARLGQDGVLLSQALDMQRIGGWGAVARDLLEILDLGDWDKNLSASLGKGREEAESGLDETQSSREEAPELLEMMEEMAPGTQGRAKFWQFLLPWPPSGAIADRVMPAAVLQEAYEGKSSAAVDVQAGFWENTFLAPASALREEGFMREVLGQTEGFLSGIAAGLSSALRKGRDKLLFTEYLLSELDFATNKPVMNRYFTRCETEFVLFGHKRSWDNVRHAVLQMFLMRVCLHISGSVLSMEVVNQAALTKAVIEGIVHGSKDIERLLAGERIAVIPGNTAAASLSALTMSYKDHLRLFLLCQNEGEQQKALRRIVQTNLWYWAGEKNAEDFALDRYGAEIRASAETEISLWPFGTIRIRREGVMGYDKPFTLLSQE